MSSGSKKRKPTSSMAEFPRSSQKKNSNSLKIGANVSGNVGRLSCRNLKKLKHAAYCDLQQKHEAHGDKKSYTAMTVLTKLPSPPDSSRGSEIKGNDFTRGIQDVNKKKLSFSLAQKSSLVKSSNVLDSIPLHKGKEELSLTSSNRNKLHGVVNGIQKNNRSTCKPPKKIPFVKTLSSNLSESNDILTQVSASYIGNNAKNISRNSYLSISYCDERPQRTETAGKNGALVLERPRSKSEDHKKIVDFHFTNSSEKIKSHSRTDGKVSSLDNKHHKSSSSSPNLQVHLKKNSLLNEKPPPFSSVNVKTAPLLCKKDLCQTELVTRNVKVHPSRVHNVEETSEPRKKHTQLRPEVCKGRVNRALYVEESGEPSKKYSQSLPTICNDRTSINHPCNLAVEPRSRSQFSRVELIKRYDRAHPNQVRSLREETQSFPMTRPKNSSHKGDTSAECSNDNQSPMGTSNFSPTPSVASLKAYGQSGFGVEAGNLRSLPVPSIDPIEDSDMEWEAIEDEKVLLDIKEHRQQCQDTGNHYDQPMEVMETNCLDLSENDIEESLIVLDTNILISHLKFVEELSKQEYEGMGCPLLVIPWMVLKELDALKGGPGKSKFEISKVKYKARLATHFINKCFSSQHPRVKGQSAVDDKDHLLVVDVPDDSILNCCLQLQKKGQRVILLSNDVNFCNKAMATGIVSYRKEQMCKILSLDKRQLADATTKSSSHGMPLKKLDLPGQLTDSSVPAVPRKRPSVQGMLKFKSLLQDFLTQLIEAEMKRIYEDMWIKIVVLKPPWTVVDGLWCLSKHWIAVFSSIMNKSAQNVIQNMINFFKTDNSREGSTLDKLEKMVQSALHLCGAIHSEHYQSLASEYKNHFVSLLKTVRESKLGDGAETHEDFAAPKIVPETSDSLADQSGSSSVLEVFQLIWNLVNEFCGVTCDILGIGHSISYQRPENFPSLEEVKRRLPEASHYVSSLVNCISSILEIPGACLSTKHPAIISLFSVIQAMVASEFLVNKAVSCDKLFTFCVDVGSRSLLMNGLQQFQEAQLLLSKVINYLECPK